MRLRWVIALLGVVLSFAAAQAQASGIRFIPFHIEPIFPGPKSYNLISGNSYGVYRERELWHLGFGFDHDFEDRLSMAVEVMFSQTMVFGAGDDDVDHGVISFQYRSCFHLQSNQEASAYIGPQVGVRLAEVNSYVNEKLVVEDRTLFPIGLRFGFRGDLRQFYADVYAAVVVQVGGEEVSAKATEVPPSLVTYAVGVDMGVGWDKRTSK